MPLPTGPLMKFVFSGAIDASNVWNIGVWWTKPAPGDGAIDYSALASDVLSKFNSDFWSATTTPWKDRCAPATTLYGCKVYGYDGGLLSGEGSASIAPVAGTGASFSPSYTACVVTLQTAAFGKSHRGRLYLPYTLSTLSTLQLGLAQSYVDNLKTFMVRNTFSGVPASPILESQVVSRTHGTSDNITKLRMDTKPDTQRGRMSKTVPSSIYSSTVRTS